MPEQIRIPVRAGGWVDSLQSVLTGGAVYRDVRKHLAALVLLAQLSLPIDYLAAKSGRGSIMSLFEGPPWSGSPGQAAADGKDVGSDDMRNVTGLQTLVFAVLTTVAPALEVATTRALLGDARLGDFRAVAPLVAAALQFFAYAIFVCRLFLGLFPLQPGEIAAASRQEFIYHD